MKKKFQVDSLEGLKDVREMIGKKFSRTLALDRSAVDEKNRTVAIAFSSEFPVERYFGYEVLDHDPKNVDLSRVPGGMAFLMNHDPDKQIGVVESVSIDPDKVGRSVVRISQNCEDVWTDIKDGIRRNISVGYEIMGILSEIPGEDGKTSVRFSWAPIEESLVAVPADYTVGVGRSLEPDATPRKGDAQVPEGTPPEGDAPETRTITGANSEGIAHARSLANAGKVTKSDSWNPPSADSENVYIKKNGMAKFGSWHMGVDSSVDKDLKGHYGYIFTSNFETVDTSGLRAIASRAGQQGQKEIGSSASSLLEKINKEKSIDITLIQERNKMDEQMKLERERVAKIEELSAKYAGRVKNMTDLRKTAVMNGLSEAEFRGLVLENITDSKPLETPRADVGFSEKDLRKYSIMRAIRAQIPGSKEDASFEREVSDLVAKQTGKEPRGFYVPYDVQRAWNIGQSAQGDALVATEFRPGSFIELLRNATFFSKAGVNFLPGLVGNLAIPRQNGAGLAYWCTETGAPTAQSGSVDQVSLTPKTIGAYQDYTRLLMLQATPAIESIVRNDILQIITLGVEKALLHGSGSNNQPQGLQYNATVTASALLTGMAGFNATSSTDLEGVIVDANVRDANLCYIMRPKFRANLKTRPLIGSTYPMFVVDKEGSMNGYPVYTTNNVESGYIFMGDFSQAWVGEWGTLDIAVDPFALSTTGGTRIIGLYNVDIEFRHPQAFTFGSPCS